VIAAVRSATREIAMVQPETGCKWLKLCCHCVRAPRRCELRCAPAPCTTLMLSWWVHISEPSRGAAFVPPTAELASCNAWPGGLRRTYLRLRFKHRVLCLGIGFLVEIVVISGHIGSQQIRAAREYR